jgi:hypothetical protein
MQANINALLRYLRDDSSLASIEAGHNDGTGSQNDYFSDFPVSIRNARNDVVPPSLFRNGFQLAKHKAHMACDKRDIDALNIYSESLMRLIKDFCSSRTELIIKHNWRASNVDPANPGNVRAPVHVVHNDYTASRAKSVFATFVPDAVKNDQPQRNFAIITAWRSIAGVIREYPLAVCDANSISRKELQDVERKGDQRSHSVQLSRFSPQHRWAYYPKMTEDEVLLFMCYDSRANSAARSTLHSAFIENDVPHHDYVRSSIETRCLMMF